MLKRTNHADDREVKRQSAELQKKKFTHDDYTVGWVCPLEVELIAALEMLEEEHEPLPQPPTDHNIYHLGSIAGHNVVIAGLWQAGNNPATAVVTQMRIRFPNLRFALLVGIGGGVPTITENGMIRLGHVVVSRPEGTFSGAIQYDHGKARDGVFERTGALAPPPPVLLLAAQSLSAQRARSDKDHIMENALRIDTTKPQLRRFKFPGVENDKLFAADYKHLSPGLSCEESECDRAQCIKREIGGLDQLIVVHRGTVASGELVVKNSALRDQLAKQYKVLCFEMEAAGAMADFPCLIIRGISDYCDSHKNDQWHGFAAAAAAAYARQLFYHMPIDVVKQQTIVPSEDPGFRTLVQRSDDQERQQMASWLCSMDNASEQIKNLRDRQDGTGQWLFETDEFRQWEREKGVLFCPGIPGAGKTILTSIVVDYLREKHGSNNSVGLAYIFCNFQQQQNQKVDIILADILGQLVRGLCHIPEPIRTFYETCRHNGMRPQIYDVLQMLGVASGLYSHVYMIIDALDECSDSDTTRDDLISHILDLQQQFNISFMATARFIPGIITQFENFPSVEIRASDADVKRYVEGNLPSIVKRKRDYQKLVVSDIIKKVGGMFLLARLYLDSLKGKCSIRAIKEALNDFKTGSDAYEHAYGKAMERIKQQVGDRAQLGKQALAWLTCAERPLTLTELQHALAVVIGESSFDEENLPDVEDMISSCAGLITYIEENHIIRLVHYTTQEYLEKTWTSWFQNVHCAIGEICITYLCYDDFEAGRCKCKDSYDQRHQKYPLYRYAAKSWLYHAKKQPLNHSLIGKLLISDQKFAAWEQDQSSEILNFFSPQRDEETTPLHLAAELGLEDEAEALLKLGHEVNATDHTGLITPLSIAVEKGHETLEQLLLQYGARYDPYIVGAALSRNEQSVKRLLERGLDVNLRDEYGRTPLYFAARWGHEGVVRLLVDAGASIDYQDNAPFGGLTPLCLATLHGHQAVVRILLNKGADPDLPDRKGHPPLMYALAEEKELYELEVLEGTRAENWIWPSTLWDAPKGSPRSIAPENNKKAVVRTLLAHGANPNRSRWRPPLSLALRKEDTELVKLLLQHGAKPRLDAWAMKGLRNNKALLEFLLNQGVLPDGVSRDRLFFWAVSGGYSVMVKILLEQKADINLQDSESGDTPIARAVTHYVSSYYGPDIFGLLIERRPDLEIGDWDGRTPLMKAASQGLDAVVKLLLETGANIRSKDYMGQTALFHAIQNRHKETSMLLLSRDPTLVDVRDRFGRRPRLLAAEMGLQLGEGIVGSDLTVFIGKEMEIVLQKMSSLGDTISPAEDGVLRAWAEANSHPAVIEALIEANSQYDRLDGLGRSPFLQAVAHHHSAVVRGYLDKSHDCNEKDKEGRSALSWAFHRGDDTIIQLLLDKGADPNAPIKTIERFYVGYSSDSPVPPLFMAAKKGFEGCVRNLLQKGADTGITIHKESALSLAVSKGHYRIVEMLLAHGVNNEQCHTSLAEAIESRNLPLASLLVERGIGTNWLIDQYGPRLLSKAARAGYTDIVRSLLDSGTKPDASSDSNQTPLYFAAREGQDGVVQLLLERGAEPNVRWSPLRAALHRGHGSTAEILLLHGAKLDIEKDGDSLLLQAAKAGDSDVVEVLLKMGVPPEPKDRGEWYPFHTAVSKNDTGVVKVFLDSGVSVNSRDGLGQMGPCLAAERGLLPMLELFIQYGFQPQTVDFLSRGALFFATLNGRQAIVELLLQNGSADPKATSCAGRSPLSIARDLKRTAILGVMSAGLDEIVSTEKQATGSLEDDKENQFNDSHVISTRASDSDDENFCHACGYQIPTIDHHFVCTVCSPRFNRYKPILYPRVFTACIECVTGGVGCLDKLHTLKERTFVNGKLVTIRKLHRWRQAALPTRDGSQALEQDSDSAQD